MSPSIVAFSSSRQTQKTTANFQEGPRAPSEGPIAQDSPFAEGRFQQGGAVGFTYDRMWANIYIERSSTCNLRNRRMTSFIDHAATINLIWFSARSNTTGDESRSRTDSCAWLRPAAVPIISRTHVYTCAIVRRMIVVNCHLYAESIRICVETVSHRVALTFVTTQFYTFNRT